MTSSSNKPLKIVDGVLTFGNKPLKFNGHPTFSNKLLKFTKKQPKNTPKTA